jgi:hypothetical protein
VTEFEQTAKGTILRPDNLFRGEGPIKTSLEKATKPYAVRLTGQNQIDDMIESGLIRPKEGGYGKNKKSIIYFSEMDTALPDSIFTIPKIGSGKEYTIVADSSKIAGRQGAIPLDYLQHVWTIRDGKMVDVLPEILQKNVAFGKTPSSTVVSKLASLKSATAATRAGALGGVEEANKRD